jgi:hypothetical protein
MADTVEVSIPVDAETARALENPDRRVAAGRYLSSLLGGGQVPALLAQAIAEAKLEAMSNGLTDHEVDDELEAWRAERRS